LPRGTDLKLTFAREWIELNILSGQASLMTSKGVVGILTTWNGEILRTDPSVSISTIQSADYGASSQRPSELTSLEPSIQRWGLMFALTLAGSSCRYDDHYQSEQRTAKCWSGSALRMWSFLFVNEGVFV